MEEDVISVGHPSHSVMTHAGPSWRFLVVVVEHKLLLLLLELLLLEETLLQVDWHVLGHRTT